MDGPGSTSGDVLGDELCALGAFVVRAEDGHELVGFDDGGAAFGLALDDPEDAFGASGALGEWASGHEGPCRSRAQKVLVPCWPSLFAVAAYFRQDLAGYTVTVPLHLRVQVQFSSTLQTRQRTYKRNSWVPSQGPEATQDRNGECQNEPEGQRNNRYRRGRSSPSL